jgi:hypothetical protein
MKYFADFIFTFYAALQGSACRQPLLTSKIMTDRGFYGHNLSAKLYACQTLIQRIAEKGEGA